MAYKYDLRGTVFLVETDEKITALKDSELYRKVWHQMLNFLERQGFKVEHQDNTLAECIRDLYAKGQKGDLFFYGERTERFLKLEFYQEINVENPHGGRYDFDKRERMPYLIGKQFELACSQLAEFLRTNFGAEGCLSMKNLTPEERIRKAYIEAWHLNDIKSMSDPLPQGPVQGQPDYNITDRDGRKIENGETRYYVDLVTGRVQRGTVYYYINNMWFVVQNDVLKSEPCQSFFTPAPGENLQGRRKPAKIPAKVKTRWENLHEASTRELLNELKRRDVTLRK